MNFDKTSTRLAFSLVFLFISTIITGQAGVSTSHNDKIAQSLQELSSSNPVFAKYFNSKENPELDFLLKKHELHEKMDSLVSVALDSSYSKVKTTYEYDENGYFTKITKIFYKDGIQIKGGSYTLDFRDDGQLNSLLRMSFRNGEWIPAEKESKIYDPHGNLIQSIREEWDTTSNSWINLSKNELTYDAMDRVIVSTSYSWSSGAWVPHTRTNWGYDSNNDLVLQIGQIWENGAWVNTYKAEYTYDTNHNIIKSNSFNWENGVWVNNWKNTYVYDSNNNMISSNSYEWNSANNVWENKYWNLYNYNSNNLLVFKLFKIWNSDNSTWRDVSRAIHDYDDNLQIISHLYEKFIDGEWQLYFREDYEYTSGGLLKSYIYTSEDRKERYNFRYNSMGLCNGGNHEIWNNDHWEFTDVGGYLRMPWMFIYKCTVFVCFSAYPYYERYAYTSYGYEFSVYYQGVTSVDENDTPPAEFTLKQNYPNPFNPATVINYQIPETEFVSLKVFDVLGNEVATLVNQQQGGGRYSVTFDALSVGRPVSSGIYFYRLQAGNNIRVRKMMLLK